jgi:hypothetical protein
LGEWSSLTFLDARGKKKNNCKITDDVARQLPMDTTMLGITVKPAKKVKGKK